MTQVEEDRCKHKCRLNPQGCTKMETLERGCACGYFCFYSDCREECGGRQ